MVCRPAEDGRQGRPQGRAAGGGEAGPLDLPKRRLRQRTPRHWEPVPAHPRTGDDWTV